MFLTSRGACFLTAEIAAYQPDVVAFGMRNIQNNDYSGIDTNLANYRALITTIRGVTKLRRL